MREAYVLFHDGHYQKMTEEQMLKWVETRYKEIKLCLVPDYDSNEMGYIPVEPTPLLCFKKASGAMAISTHTLNYDTSQHEMNGFPSTCETESAFEFVNWLQSAYHISGYNYLLDLVSDLTAPDFVSMLRVDYITLKIKGKDGEKLYKNEADTDIANTMLDIVETTLDVGPIFEAIEMDPQVKDMVSDFIHEIRRKEYFITLKDGEWFWDRKVRKNADFCFYGLNEWNVYVKMTRKLWDFLYHIPAVYLDLMSFYTQDESSPLQYIWNLPGKRMEKELIKVYGDRMNRPDLDPHDEVSIYCSEIDHYLYIILFGNLILSYAKFVIFCARFEMRQPLEYMRAIMFLNTDQYSYEPSSALVSERRYTAEDVLKRLEYLNERS